MCHVMGRLGGFDVVVDSVTHTSLTLVWLRWFRGCPALVLVEIIVGGFVVTVALSGVGAVEVGYFPWLTAIGWGGTGGAGVSCWFHTGG